MGGYPKRLYTDADSTCTADLTKQWLAHAMHIAHAIELTRAPVAERMLDYITKTQIYRARKGTNKKGWAVVDDVVKGYNNEHVNRRSRMTPSDCGRHEKKKRDKVTDASGEHQKEQ